jgi:4'-phosphopantetheinyl transferase
MTAEWLVAPPGLPAIHERIDVWRVALDRPADEVAALGRGLAPAERERAARMARPLLRQRFVVAHGALRRLLADDLGRDPRDLRLVEGTHGKPALAPGEGRGLSFNLSHSDDQALIAVTRDRAVGVDLERIRPDLDPLPLAERFFAAEEVATLRRLAGGSRLLGFYLGWTRKEAYLKARGLGLSRAPAQICVSLQPGGPARLLDDAADSEAAMGWFLADLAPGDGYVGALAIEGADYQVATWEWVFRPS